MYYFYVLNKTINNSDQVPNQTLIYFNLHIK